jgi:hypothetical protein
MSYIRKGFKLFKFKFWKPVQEEAPLVLDLKRLLKLKFWNPVQEETLIQDLKRLLKFTLGKRSHFVNKPEVNPVTKCSSYAKVSKFICLNNAQKMFVIFLAKFSKILLNTRARLMVLKVLEVLV